MGLFINTNVASLNAQRNLTQSTKSLGRTFQRLSTGKRINSAADDAAGLAISTRFTAQIRGLNQAVRNTNDGISMAQTVEGALQESTNILQRMRELAVQAANDINTEKDRESLNAEVEQLIGELNRIGDTTTFNSQKVINGDFVQSFFHVGANARETLTIRVRDARATALGLAAVATAANVSDAVLDRNGNGGAVQINGITIRTTSVTDDTLSTTQQASSAIAKATAINDMTDFHGVTARALETELAAGQDITAGTLDSANFLQINGEVITGFNVVVDDANSELTDQINSVSTKTGVIASLDENQQLVLTAVDGRNIEVNVEGNAGAITGLNADSVTRAGLEFSSEDQYSITDVDGGLAALGFAADQLIGVTRQNAVSTVSVLDRVEANRTIEVVDRALAQISQDRSDLGAVQNRLESTVRNLTTVSENLTASRSRIEDADFAMEAATLAKNQILQQAGTSILAQANQAGQIALSLLS